MSLQEKGELEALIAWALTFPGIEEVLSSLQQTKPSVNLLSLPEISSAILEVAGELCGSLENESVLGHSGDVWDHILLLTQRASSQNKQNGRCMNPPVRDQPDMWSYTVHYAALSNLLDLAVSHAELEWRKKYIERIMKLPQDRQRHLMALIERRKQQRKRLRTPKKPAPGSGTKSKLVSNHCQPSPGDASTKPAGTPSISSDLDTSKVKKNSHREDREALFQSPTLKSKAELSPRRSFDLAFPGEDETPKRPSPKRVGVESSFFSPGLGDSAEIANQFEILKTENETLSKQLATKEEEKAKLAARIEDAEADFRNQLMKVEARAANRWEENRMEYQQEVKRLRDEISRMQHQCSEASKAQAKLAGFQDEIELMVHTRKELADAQERLTTYREKVQQLSDVREALKREEEAHSKSVEECLRLENELQNMQPLKRQLEDYKARAVEAEVRLAEASNELQKLSEQKWLTGTASTDLEKTVQAQQEEIMELRARLHQESSKSSSDEAGSVGEGLSELNPELKEEVLRLRNENQRLQAFKAKREDDAVSKLEGKHQDAVQLGNRFKEQYLNTREQLEHTQRNLRASTDRETKLRNDVKDALEKIKETQTMVDDLSQQLYRSNEDLTVSRNREAELERELSKWVEQSKDFQNQSSELTGELRARSNELEASKSREVEMSKEINRWKENLKEEEERHNETRNSLEATESSFQDFKIRAVELQDQVDHWMTSSQKLESRIQALNGHIEKGKSMLNESRASEDRLRQQATQATQFLAEANNKCEELMGQISETRAELYETNTKLQKSEEAEARLQNELMDTTQRAEDAEFVSQQRKDLIETTRSELKDAQTEIEELQDANMHLELNVEDLTNQVQASEAQAADLQATVTEMERKLDESEQANELCKSHTEELEERNRCHLQSAETLKANLASAEDRVSTLASDLSNEKAALEHTKLKLKSLQSDRINMEENINHAGNIIFFLEDALDSETNARHLAEELLEESRHDYDCMQKEFEGTSADLRSQIDDFQEKIAQIKIHLHQSQAEASELESSLGASQHREKMLNLDISKLNHRISELEGELHESKIALERAVTESENSLESTCKVINANAQKEIDGMRTKMNRAVEEERRARRQADEKSQQDMKKLRETFEAEIQKWQGKSDQEKIDASNNLNQLKSNYELQLEKLKQEHEDEKNRLVAKGKGMLSDVQTSAAEEKERLERDLQEVESRLESERKDKDAIILHAKNKVSGYKKKLEFASSRINTLTSDFDELERRMQSLEREKFKLVEENDRYRRQLGGRGGPDSQIHSQFEQLQKEFKSAMEEARELRRKLKEKEDLSVSLGTIDENSDPSYSRNSVTQSTLVQLRTEYEEMIEALNDEKRELVMKNSAAATDVQKAERRAWESEQENSALKQQITSLQLQVERLEHMIAGFENDTPPPPPPPRASAPRNTASKRPRKTAKGNIPETLHEDDGQRTERTRNASPMIPSSIEASEACILSQNRDYNNKVASPSSPTLPTFETKDKESLPSFVDLHKSNETKQETPPECAQS